MTQNSTVTDTAEPLETSDRTTATVAAPGTVRAERETKLSTLLFWVLLAGGLALRIVFVFSVGHVEDSDHAVVYLISKHVSEGHVDWFFWGQAYGGTLLEIIAGGAMLVFGPSVAVLSIVSATIFAIVAFLLREITSQALGRTAGNVAGILFWFPGFILLRQSTTDPGFYSTSLCLGLLAIWLAVRGPARKGYAIWACLGLCAGLALWQSPMGAALVAPALVVAIVKDRSWRHIAVGALAAIVGALPWLVQLASSFSAVKPQVSSGGFHLSSLISFFTTLIPSMVPVDAKPERFIVAGLTLAALGLLLVLTIVRRSLSLGTLLASTLLCIGVILIGANAVLTGSTVRYAIYVIPALAVALAWLFTRVRFVGVLAMLVAAGLTFSQTLANSNNLQLSNQNEFGVGYEQLESLLESKGVDAAYGEYWLAYRLTAVSNEDVTVASLLEHPYEPYDEAASAERPAAILVFTDDAADTYLRTTPGLPQSTRLEDGDYTIYLYNEAIDPSTFAGAPF